MHRRFTEYFRCPSSYADFNIQGEPTSEPGFFRFTPDLICYGKLSSGLTNRDHRAQLHDSALPGLIEQGKCCLPFDPDEISDNLCLERYRNAQGSAAGSPNGHSLSRKAYYAVRPLLPVSIRKHLQRAALRGWDQVSFPRWPVDHTVDDLFDRLMASAIRANRGRPIPFIWFWPHGYSACAIMTHDVETSAGRDFCETLMDLDDSFGVKSSFQIVPQKRYAVPETFLHSLRQRGFEINVHDFNHDGELYWDRQEFLQRVAKINGYGRQFGAVGFRAAVLYRNLDWYDSFDFSYDMSVPNVGHLDPQPGGCCTTKPYFIGKILEIPVTATQDYTLFNILRQYSTDLWERQTAAILGRHGLMNFIAHPDYLFAPREREVYTALLAHLAQLRRESHVWIPLPREVNDWWRSRNEMTLSLQDGTWQISGPDKDRARLAFASLDRDRVIYTRCGHAGAAVAVPDVVTDVQAGPLTSSKAQRPQNFLH
jgi:hypothetical protein